MTRTQRRKTIYGKPQVEALAKLAEIKQRLANGTYTDTNPTVKSYLKQWLEEKKWYVKPTTHEVYLTGCTPFSILGMATSLRRGELLGLCWDDIQGNVLQVKRALVKAKGRLELCSQNRT